MVGVVEFLPSLGSIRSVYLLREAIDFKFNNTVALPYPNRPALINPLSTDIKMYILLTVLRTFRMELVRRICLNIQTSYPW